MSFQLRSLWKNSVFSVEYISNAWDVLREWLLVYWPSDNFAHLFY